jgi:rhamnosyl/mannosyltransferase
MARLDVSARLPLELREVIAEGVDVLHLHVPNPTFLLALATMPLGGTNLVVTHHSDVIRQRLLRHVIRPVEDVVYRRARSILATSPRYVDGSDVLRAHAAKVEVVPLGIESSSWSSPDDADVRRLRERIDLDDGEPLWLSVGRLVYYKGLSTAVQALARVPGRWLVVGSGPDQSALRAQAERLGVARRITWSGELSGGELKAAYQLATALWFPSNARSEAFGLVQLEAMAAGCPVINCAIAGSGVPWVARDSLEALTVRPGDAEGFGAAARRLIEAPGLRDRLAAGARTRAATFDVALLAARTLEVYRGALRTA